MRIALCIVYVFFSLSIVQAQINLRGYVYKDSLSKKPIDSALVYLKSGAYYFTDRLGGYEIPVVVGDTLRVYHQGRTLSFFISQTMAVSKSFDICLNETLDDNMVFHQLAPVSVRNSTYTKDSISNRQEYADIFNYKKGQVSMGNNKWRDSVNGLALNTQDKKLSLLNFTDVWQSISTENKQKLRLQKRLVETEQSNYIDRVFTPALVEKYTAMHDDDSLHIFIRKYAPTYEEILTMNELDIAQYIVRHVAAFRKK